MMPVFCDCPMCIDELTQEEAAQKVLDKDQSRKIAPRKCFECGKSMTRWAASSLKTELDSTICTCGSMLDIWNTDLSILPGSADFVDATKIPGSRWYHCTVRPEWPRDIMVAVRRGGPEYVHVGTRYAARTLHNNERHGECGHMFSMYVRAGVKVYPKIVIDNNGWLSVQRRIGTDWDVVRYINRFESAGSISLMVKPHALDGFRKIWGPRVDT